MQDGKFTVLEAAGGGAYIGLLLLTLALGGGREYLLGYNVGELCVDAI